MTNVATVTYVDKNFISLEEKHLLGRPKTVVNVALPVGNFFWQQDSGFGSTWRLENYSLWSRNL